MKVLVIGSGGREHAICRAFSKSGRVDAILCAPGNAGIATIAECVDIAADNVPGLVELAAARGVEMTFVGGEASLAAGIVDAFSARGLTAIGPVRDAAQLESSKSFAKDFMARHGIPTAKYSTAHTPEFAIDMLDSGDFGGPETPVVIKADGLAAGKGVVVAANRREAESAINALTGLVGHDAAQKIIVEECLTGREVSLLLFCDGTSFNIMPPCRDHKRIGDGDTGPNTGGMGTITDASLLSADQLADITDHVIVPTLHGCHREGFPFKGVLFLGLMLTGDGPKVLEYNVRFGDPEAQAILIRLETDLLDLCEAISKGTLRDLDVSWRPGSSACVVMAAEGYPGHPRVGDPINGLMEAAGADVEIFYAGTKLSEDGAYLTSGGRVLGVTAIADDLTSALDKAYASVSKISWRGMQYRQDIGH